MSTRAETLAAAVHRRLGMEGPPASPALLLAYAPIETISVDWPEDVAAVLVLRDGLATIGLNRRHSTVRRHFSFWHEVGHYLLHRARWSGAPCSAPATPGAPSRREREADAFAANVLMPEAWVTRAWREANGRRSTGAVGVAALARRFRVSHEAMARRLEELGLP